VKEHFQVQSILGEPRSYDEALKLRAELIEEVDRLQDSLSVRSDLEWRTQALAELSHKRSLLRQLKEWLRRHDPQKMSEWELLAIAHQFLERVAALVGDGNALDAEREALLDAIELVVPGQYLNKPR
jgi:hypothetical protein